VIACAASVGSTPAWAGAAVVAALVAGGLLVAVVRYRTLVELVADADRLPAWPWLLAVTGTVVGVVAVAALLNGLIGVDVLRWALDALGALLGYVLGALAWAIGWAGAGVLWLVRWLLGLIHVKAPSTGWTPPHAPKAPTIVPRPEDSWLAAGITRLIATVVGATAAIVGSLAVVVLALRRMRRRRPAEAVVEERESLGSLRSAAGAFVGGLGRRLGRLAAARRRRPLTPAEEVRRLYAQLERRLTTAGQPRLPGVTVREYLAAVLTADGASHDTASPAADLAATYELARYSAHALDPGQSRRFADLARGSSPRAT
jgi:hypothetical protein